MLPAYAGMILDQVAFPMIGRGAPRVCGDDPPNLLPAGILIKCSPRMRG